MPRCRSCGQRTRVPHEHAEPLAPEDEAPTPSESAPDPIELSGYEFGDLLGLGGFGAVFRARRSSDGLPVAIKLARPDRHSADVRLLHEADVLTAIGPPHVPVVYDRGSVPGIATYVVMELIEAPTLARVMEERAPLAPALFPQVAHALLESLTAVHKAGFTHRDLKPENIFWDAEAGRATLIDFSLGRPVASEEGEVDVTETGIVMGTVEYMAPEQCVPGSPIDHRADLYAVGVLMHELLTGHPPFWGAPKTVRLSHQVRRPPPMELAEPYPGELEKVIMRCLAKGPEARFQTAHALQQALRQAASQEPGQARRRSRRKRVRARPTAMEMPVIYFRSHSPLGAIQELLSRYGCALANVSGERYVAVLTELSGESPVERASMAASGLVEMTLSTGATVDFSRVTRRVGPDGSLRHRSASFSREHLYPEDADAGVLLTDEAERALPTRVQVPLLGRDAIVENLLVDISTAVERRIPTISTVIGAGGHGKSALADKLSEIVSWMYPDAQVLSLRASPPVGGEAQTTLRRMLEWTFRLTDAGLEALERPSVLELLGESLAAELGPALALGMGWVDPDHPLVADIAAAPGALRAATFRLLGEGLRRRARRTPVLVILDDAHMTDDSTLDGLEYATLEDLGLPIWVCALARGGFENARPSWAMRAGRQRRLQLDPLDEVSAAELCRELLKPARDVPERVIAGLVRRSQAIPLLLVELVQGLKRDRIVRRHKGSEIWFVASDEIDLHSGMPLLNWLAQSELNALPKDLAAHARLAALLDDGFRAAELAGVMRELERDGLAADFPLDATAGLNSLWALGMLVRDTGDRLRFRHDFLREAIAQMLPRARRTELHAAAYRAYRDLDSGDEMDDARRARIAYHAARAGLTENAIPLYLELAERASRSHDYIGAERLYTRALELLPDTDRSATRMQAVHGRALMRYRTGRYVDSLEDFAQGRELAAKNRDLMAEIEILLDEATALDWLDRHKQSSKQVLRAQLLAYELERSRLINARLQLGVGRSYWRADRFERARVKLQECIGLVEEHGAEAYETLLTAYIMLGCVLSVLDDTGAASDAFERAVKLCEERGDLFHLAAALNNRRYVWVARSEVARVVEDADRCIEIGRALGITGFEFAALYNVAEVLYHQGDMNGAWPYIERAIRVEQQRATAVGAGRPISVILAARVYCYLGEREQARTLWRQMDTYHKSALEARDKERQLKPPEIVLVDMVDLMTRESSRAEWDELLARSSKDSVESEPSEVVEMMGIWARQQGDLALARDCFERALTMARSVPTLIHERITAQLQTLSAAASRRRA